MRYGKKLLCLLLCVSLAGGCFACNKNKENEEPTEVKTNIVENIDELQIADSEYDLIKNGNTEYKILLPQEPTPSERTAASELTEIFFQSSGITLETVTEVPASGKYISIGDTAPFTASDLKVDGTVLKTGGFIINRIGASVFINANTESGKIYGVYTFCEKNLDYMYFYADEIRYVHTDNKKLLDFDITVVPSFEGRNAFSRDTHYDFAHAMRLKVNNSINGAWPEEYGEQSMWSVLSDQSIVHEIVPVWDYYDEHPEWYYINERVAGTEFGKISQSDAFRIAKESMQLCYTKGYYEEDDEGKLLFKTFVDNLINNYIAVEKDKTLFMVGMADNPYACNCAKCVEDAAKYKHSGIMMRFMNKVAAAVEKWIKEESGTPDRQIYLVTFAYYAYMDAPSVYNENEWKPIDPSVVGHKYVCLRMAPLGDANYYWRLDDPQHNTFLSNSIAGWKTVTPNFAIWDYRVHYNTCVVQYPYWNVVKSNLELYKEIGVIDIFHQGIEQTSGIAFSRLDDYVRARLMFNINADERKLTDAFIDAYYKNAAPFIREYREFLRMHYETYIIPQGYNPGVYAQMMYTKYWPIETLEQMKHIFEKAYASIENCDSETKALLKARIDVESRFYRYMEIELYANIYLSGDALRQAIDDFVDANQVNPLMQHAVRNDIANKIAEWRSKIQ